MTESKFEEKESETENSPSNKFCSTCGTEIEAGTKFCPDCGTAQEGEPNAEKAIKQKEGTKISFSKITAYFFGGAGLVLGLLFLATGPASAGFFLGIAGVIGFPKSRNQVEEKLGIKLSKWVATALFLVFWMTGAALL
ncbi:zinc-ribbon domain-containing protein [Natronosalvus rutilus]|uniref:Zinc ribbon domain-containing protein n=1 Tax=Natronosalvus rutilus TaxID=2953753 RepID=A0A9E7NB40_9EURY|nr:zinc ribbon domain-containing protein [Natronosalvus rutilus]UTF53422.1 zinc ribbon domain-containing protein [Natronosalvus rutilus]